MEQSPRKALLVEDEPLVAMVVEDILDALGFSALSVGTAAEGLSALDQGGFGLAVIDIGLPDMRGDDLAVRVRARNPLMPIVLASGYDAAELKQRFGHDPAVAVLSKPYTESDLREAVSAMGAQAPEV